jgi:hypothetical protein
MSAPRRHLIPHVNRVVHHEVPELQHIDLRCGSSPVHYSADKHCACPRGSCANNALCDTILVICTNAGERQFLALNVEVGPEVFSSEWSIVTMVLLGSHTMVTGEFLEGVFVLESFTNMKRNLMEMVDIRRVMVQKKRASVKLHLFFLFLSLSLSLSVWVDIHASRRLFHQWTCILQECIGSSGLVQIQAVSKI